MLIFQVSSVRPPMSSFLGLAQVKQANSWPVLGGSDERDTGVLKSAAKRCEIGGSGIRSPVVSLNSLNRAGADLRLGRELLNTPAQGSARAADLQTGSHCFQSLLVLIGSYDTNKFI